MKIFKKISVLILSLGMFVGVASCGGNTTPVTINFDELITIEDKTVEYVEGQEFTIEYVTTGELPAGYSIVPIGETSFSEPGTYRVIYGVKDANGAYVYLFEGTLNIVDNRHFNEPHVFDAIFSVTNEDAETSGFVWLKDSEAYLSVLGPDAKTPMMTIKITPETIYNLLKDYLPLIINGFISGNLDPEEYPEEGFEDLSLLEGFEVPEDFNLNSIIDEIFKIFAAIKQAYDFFKTVDFKSYIIADEEVEGAFTIDTATLSTDLQEALGGVLALLEGTDYYMYLGALISMIGLLDINVVMGENSIQLTVAFSGSNPEELGLIADIELDEEGVVSSFDAGINADAMGFHASVSMEQDEDAYYFDVNYFISSQSEEEYYYDDEEDPYIYRTKDDTDSTYSIMVMKEADENGLYYAFMNSVVTITDYYWDDEAEEFIADEPFTEETDYFLAAGVDYFYLEYGQEGGYENYIEIEHIVDDEHGTETILAEVDLEDEYMCLAVISYYDEEDDADCLYVRYIHADYSVYTEYNWEGEDYYERHLMDESFNDFTIELAWNFEEGRYFAYYDTSTGINVYEAEEEDADYDDYNLVEDESMEEDNYYLVMYEDGTLLIQFGTNEEELNSIEASYSVDEEDNQVVSVMADLPDYNLKASITCTKDVDGNISVNCAVTDAEENELANIDFTLEEGVAKLEGNAMGNELYFESLPVLPNYFNADDAEANAIDLKDLIDSFIIDPVY